MYSLKSSVLSPKIRTQSKTISSSASELSMRLPPVYSTEVISTALPEEYEGIGLYSAHPTACLNIKHISRPSHSMKASRRLRQPFSQLPLLLTFFRPIPTFKTSNRLCISSPSYCNIQHLRVEQSHAVCRTRCLKKDASSGTTPIPTTAPAKWIKSTSTAPWTPLAIGTPGHHLSLRAAHHSGP